MSPKLNALGWPLISMTTIEQIQQELESQTLLPARAADLMPLVASKYARAADNYIIANAKFAQEFTKIRDDFKSDTATERHLNKGEVGLTLHRWKYQMKKCEIIMKALNGFVYSKTAEARNEI